MHNQIMHQGKAAEMAARAYSGLEQTAPEMIRPEVTPRSTEPDPESLRRPGAKEANLKDNRAVLHVAGPIAISPIRGNLQRCTRCGCLLNSGGYIDSHWVPGATLANHGHGSWSRIDTAIALDAKKYRQCGRNSHVDPVFAGILNSWRQQ